MRQIHCYKHDIRSEDINNVKKVLKSKSITQGNEIIKFEKSLSNKIKIKYVSIVNSGTSALDVACKSLGIKKNDLVLTTPISFVATANCALYNNAKVKFVDIDYNTGNLSPIKLETFLKNSKKKPKLVILSHHGGNICDMEYFYKLKKKYNFFLIEDACHALGGKYIKNKKVGSCHYSDITTFSFHAVKNITTGEGGALCTKDIKLHKNNKKLLSHGIDRENFKNKFIYIPEDLYYEQHILGYNYRLTDIQASLGLSQLKRLESNISKREKIYNFYKNSLVKIPEVTFLKEIKGTKSGRHLAIILIKNNLRNKLYEYLKKNKIYCKYHYIPIYRQPYHKKLLKIKNFNKFINSENYMRNALSLPLHNNLSDNDMNYIVEKINKFFHQKNK